VHLLLFLFNTAISNTKATAALVLLCWTAPLLLNKKIPRQRYACWLLLLLAVSAVAVR
jgi:uncharacterized membrane protein